VAPSKEYVVDLLLISAVMIWGFNYALMKVMYRYFDPITYNALRFVVASAAMLTVIKFRGERLHLDRKDRRGILWLGLLANTLYPFLYALGLARTNAGNAALLMALTPVFAFLIGVITKKETFSPPILLGIILSLTGAAAIVAFGSGGVSLGGGSWSGNLLMIFAAMCWGWQSVEQTHLLPKYGPIHVTVWSMIAGTSFMVPLSIPWLAHQNLRGIPVIAWMGLAYSALLSITYSYFVWAYALGRIGVSHTSVFNNVTPIVAVLSGWFLLAERPSTAQLAGVALVLTGVFMVRSRKPTMMPDEE
jgi:drug/metabolite transporter (DMT)-like permease